MSMRFSNSVFTVDSHTAGHPTRIVVGGLPAIRGNSVAEKRDYVKERMDHIRSFLCNEPRGHSGMYGAIVTEPANREADIGVIFFSPVGYDDMCGHGTIGVTTVLAETGMVPLEEPLTEVTLETPAGLVRATARVVNGRVKSVSFLNVPAFVYKPNVSVDVPGYGMITGDVAFGGNWYFYVDAREAGVRVRPENIDELLRLGMSTKTEFNRRYALKHPTDSNISKELLGVSFVDSPIKNHSADQSNIVVEGKRFFDRSPCGTGTSGRMAVLFARGELALNQAFVNESISGTVFRGRLVEEARVGGYPAVVAEITGSAYITGFSHFVLSSDDPFGLQGLPVGQSQGM